MRSTRNTTEPEISLFIDEDRLVQKKNYAPWMHNEHLEKKIHDCSQKHLSRSPAALRFFSDIFMCIIFPIGVFVALSNYMRTGSVFLFFGQTNASKRQEELEQKLKEVSLPFIPSSALKKG